jgi:protein-tyrosine-phosphatase
MKNQNHFWNSAYVVGIVSFLCRAGLTALLLACVLGPAKAAERTPVDRSTVVFVCEHGAVKSTVAAAYFNRIARERGLPYVAVSRGIDLYPDIPTIIRRELANDGLAPQDDTPRDLRTDEADIAARVVAFDRLPTERSGAASVTYWSDVPAVTKDYSAGRDAILHHIEALAAELAATR